MSPYPPLGAVTFYDDPRPSGVEKLQGQIVYAKPGHPVGVVMGDVHKPAALKPWIGADFSAVVSECTFKAEAVNTGPIATTWKVSGGDERPDFCTCTAKNPSRAHWCSRCGGRIRPSSKVWPWVAGAMARPVKMAWGAILLPVMIALTAITLFLLPWGTEDDSKERDKKMIEEMCGSWSYWSRMILPDTLRKILR